MIQLGTTTLTFRRGRLTPLPEIVLAVARFGFLVLLWMFVFTVVGVIRRDLFAGAGQPAGGRAPRGRPSATGVPGRRR